MKHLECSGLDERRLPVDESAEQLLKKRTLSKLYNERPTWLANLHANLDAALCAAYDWPADITDDRLIEHLLALNLDRAAAQDS